MPSGTSNAILTKLHNVDKSMNVLPVVADSNPLDDAGSAAFGHKLNELRLIGLHRQV